MLERRTQQIDGARRRARAAGFETFVDVADHLPSAFFAEWVESFGGGGQPISVRTAQGPA
jgi:hypothetical protein